MRDRETDRKTDRDRNRDRQTETERGGGGVGEARLMKDHTDGQWFQSEGGQR